VAKKYCSTVHWRYFAFTNHSAVFTAYNVDLSSQLKAARQQAEVSRQELTEYKDKAARILQVLYITSELFFFNNVLALVSPCN